MAKYLEKYNREYELLDDIFTVNVHGKADAMKLGLNLRLDTVEYFDGKASYMLQLLHKKKSGRPRNTVFDETGKGMTLRQFGKKNLKDVQARCMRKSDILKQGIVTKKSLQEAIDRGQLQEIRIGRTTYIDRKQLLGILSGQQRLGV